MRFELAVVGASLGGLSALRALLGALPPVFPVPLVVVQHRGREADASLLTTLKHASKLPVIEVEDKQPLQAGWAYLAPADYHLLIERGSLALSTEGPVLYARPAIDVLFETAADAYNNRVIGVLLTGASADGAQGLATIKARGGCAIVQEPADAECPVMPQAALDATAVDHVLPLAAIAPLLIRLCQACQG